MDRDLELVSADDIGWNATAQKVADDDGVGLGPVPSDNTIRQTVAIDVTYGGGSTRGSHARADLDGGRSGRSGGNGW